MTFGQSLELDFQLAVFSAREFFFLFSGKRSATNNQKSLTKACGSTALRTSTNTLSAFGDIEALFT